MSNTTNDPYISIIVPAFNEISSLPELIDEITGAMEGHRYEMIIVNDGSTDGTREYLDELAEKKRQVKIIHLRKPNLKFR